MVQFTEVEGMFWGTVVGAGKKYTLPVEKSFSITMAALDVQKTKDSEPVTLVLKRGDVEYVLCTLVKGSVFQQKLDLMFEMGEDVELLTRGNGDVHLTGYFVGEQDFGDDMGEDFDECEDDEEEFDDDMDLMDMDDDEEEEEEEKEVVVKGKRKKVEVAAAPAKKAKVEEKKPVQNDKKADNKKQDNKQNKNNQQKKPEQPKSVPATPEGGKKKKNKKNKNKKNKSN